MRHTEARRGAPQLRRGTITRLAAKGRDCHRLSVHIDGRALFDLAAEVVAGHDLRQGVELGEDEQALLLLEDEPYRAREAALVMLGRREFCAAEVAGRLRDAGYREEVVDSSVEWLREHRFVDDARYAKAYVAEKTRAGWGRRRIVAELTRKGVDRHILAVEHWHELSGGKTTEQLAADLAEEVNRRFGEQLRREPSTGRRRAGGFLARRGHDWDTIGEVLRLVECLDEKPPDTENWVDHRPLGGLE